LSFADNNSLHVLITTGKTILDLRFGFCLVDSPVCPTLFHPILTYSTSRLKGIFLFWCLGVDSLPEGSRKVQEETVKNEVENWLKDLTLRMAQAIVGNPDQVRIEVTEGASMIVLELSVDPDDMGRIIGKKGQVANAMRTLLRSSAAKNGKRVNLEIIQP
jgi:predicted RNA-binding protein YlqC (UPF0109 family)